MRRGKRILADAHNPTMHMNVRWFARLIDAFSKRAENHSHALALYFVFYNFVRIHRTFGLVWRRVRSAMVMENVVVSIDQRDALRAGTLTVG